MKIWGKSSLLTTTIILIKMGSNHSILFILSIWSLAMFCSCVHSSEKSAKKTVFSAGRKAPLGWVFLEIYDNKSFEFTSQGIRIKSVYPGIVKLTNDTLYFTYNDSIPTVGNVAVISHKRVSYVEGMYPESLEIKINTLIK